MRILMLNDRLSARGGADRHLLALLDKLREGAETLLAVGFDDGSVLGDETGVVGPWLRLKGLDSSGLSQKGLNSCLHRLKELARDFRPDLIHLHNIMDPRIIKMARSLGACVMTVQDHRAFCPGAGKIDRQGRICQKVLSPDCGECFGEKSYGRKMLLLTLDRLTAIASLDRILVLSTYMKEQLALAFGAHGLPCPLIEVLPPFVHGLSAATGARDGKYHLLACRLAETKGVKVALDAFDLLREPAELVVAGHGPLADEVRLRAESSGGRIKYLPWAGRERMSGLLAGAVSVWLPSLWAEPFGIIGLEAMFMARPVVASDVGGVTDWLEHGQNGLLVPPGDAGELAMAADRLAGDGLLADRMGRHGINLVLERFGPGRLMGRLMDVYRDSLGAA